VLLLVVRRWKGGGCGRGGGGRGGRGEEGGGLEGGGRREGDWREEVVGRGIGRRR